MSEADNQPIPDARHLGFDAAQVLEGISDAFFTLDSQWRFTYLNAEAERLLMRARAVLLGRNIWTEFPEAVGTDSEREYGHAMGGQAASFEQFYPPLDKWFEARAYPSADGIAVFFRDITQRKWEEKERERSTEALRQSEERYRLLAEGLEMGTWHMDVRTGETTFSPRMAELYLLPRDAVDAPFGALLDSVHPDDRVLVQETVRRSVAEIAPVHIEHRVVGRDGEVRWIEGHGRTFAGADGQPSRFEGIAFDTTARVERQQRERFLADLAQQTQRLSAPTEVIAEIVRSVGQFLEVSRCTFADIDIAADTCSVWTDYRADDSIASMAGSLPLSVFGPYLTDQFRAGRAVAVNDVHTDPARVPESHVAAYDAVGIRAFAAVPVLHTKRLVSVLAVHSVVPRHWRPEELELLQAVVERTWPMVEILRQQSAVARESEERREAHERTESILESITGAFYALDADWRFTYVNRHSESLWGRDRSELLGHTFLGVFPEANGSPSLAHHQSVMAERIPAHFEALSPILGRWVEVNIYPTADGGLSVFFHDISGRKALEDERVRLAEDNRLLLESTGDGIYGIDKEGRFTFINRAAEQMLRLAREQTLGHNAHALIHHARPDGTPYPEEDCPIYRTLRTGESSRMEDDVFWREDGTAIPVSYSAAPIFQDGAVHGAVVTFSNIRERKAMEEEREQLAERERNISQQLQTALQPGLPGTVPGLALARYYEAALAESEGVGGDFYDVFVVEKGCTALAVGDLSGKGLVAAAQVATVRNMLRAFVYTRSTLAEAVIELNAVLAENNLLTGFTTLFVCAYDAGERTLRYVNCGQEPALLLRSATGRVEQLPPTGPVLGSFEGASFEERTVRLSPGDAIAIFSDGLTEVGPSRKDMLGIEGVMDILERGIVPAEIGSAEAFAESLALKLIEGVDAAAAGGVARDDICLLIGVIT